MRILLGLLGLLSGLWPGAASALRPDKAFHHHLRQEWSIEAGLPQITVAALAQDPTGYLWIGTQAGLARFDGVRFTTFTPENEPGIPGIWIHALHPARDGRLWVGTYKGVAVYDEGTNAPGSGRPARRRTVVRARRDRKPRLRRRAGGAGAVKATSTHRAGIRAAFGLPRADSEARCERGAT